MRGWQRFLFGTAGLLFAAGAPCAIAEVVDTAAVRDVASLEVVVVEDWRPAKNDPGVRRKLVEITVCEWWPGQKVRIPVTFNAPAEGPACENLLFMSMGLAPKISPRIDPVAGEMLARGVGVIQVGIGTIDQMAPRGMLQLGMREWLLKTKAPRYSSRWIWGMSVMRALTAALSEEDVFKGARVVATGGSKRGIASAFAAIHDERFTGIMPVVAPPVGPAAGGAVSGLASKAIMEADAAFRADLAAGKLGIGENVLTLLDERDARRGASRVSVEEALAAGWSREDMKRVIGAVAELSGVAKNREALDARGVEYFYCVGTNDTVTPGLLELGREHPDFPIWIVPGGMHGGPKMGKAIQVPQLPGTKENLRAFCSQHFFGDRPRPSMPVVSVERGGGELRVVAQFAKGPHPEESILWWSFDRSPAGSLPSEHDGWESAPMKAGKNGVSWAGEIQVPKGVKRVDFVTVHRDGTGKMPVHFSGPYLRSATNDE